MNIRQLEVFAAVMRSGSMTGAAIELGLTQPAVTKIIRHAESQLGIQLFQRVKKRLHPTEDARLIFPAIDMIFQNIKSVNLMVDDLKDKKSDVIRIASIPVLASSILPQAIASFLASHPAVKLQVKVMPGRALIPRVANHQVDLAIGYSPIEGNSTNSIELCSAEVVCVLPQSHELVKKDQISPQDLRHESLISISKISNIGEKIEETFKLAGVRRNSNVETSYSHLAYDLVAKGVGIAIVDPFTLIHHRPQGIVVKPFRPTVKIHLRAFHSAGQRPSPLIRNVIKCVKEAAEVIYRI